MTPSPCPATPAAMHPAMSTWHHMQQAHLCIEAVTILMHVARTTCAAVTPGHRAGAFFENARAITLYDLV